MMNKVFKNKMRNQRRYDTFAMLRGSRNPNKKIERRLARKKFKQDKFYNGFYEFLEQENQRVKNIDKDIKE